MSNNRVARGSTVQTGQDGSYILVRRSGIETIIGTDFTGYYKLFLYQRGERWAISNSFIQLVRFAAGKDLPVTVDESHLASFFIDGPFGDQLTSLRTSIKEIRLIPAPMEAVIRPAFFGSSVTLRPTRAATADEPQNSYGEALRDYLRLWVGRMATLLQSDLHMRSDLTGGRDSRAVLSLMLAAAKQIGEDSIRKVNFTSDKGSETDFSIAGRIADRYRLRFMDVTEDGRAPIRLGAGEAYEKWKSLCLGVYGPIYFPVTRPVATAVRFGGAGGEGHRRFYPGIAPEKFINAQRAFLPSSTHFRRMKRDILEDLSFLSRGTEASVHPMVLHYRHFRDRCHGGRAPQYGNLLSPLSGADLRKASSICSSEHIERSQVIADILINADHDLASMPYDDSNKSFDTRHFAEKIDAAEAIQSAGKDGKVFAAEQPSLETGDFTAQKAFCMLRDDFLAHYEEMRSAGFFPRQYIESARKAVEEAAIKGRLSHARSGSAISHVILAGELSRLAS